MDSNDTLLRGPRDVWLDPGTGNVGVADQLVELSRPQFSMLALLLRRRGEVVTFDELMRVGDVFSKREDMSPLHTAIHRVRRSLEAAGAPDVIRSRRGWGYQVPQTEGVAPSRALVDAVLDAMQTPVLVVDSGGVIIFANDVARETRKVDVGDRPSARSLTAGGGVRKSALEVAGEKLGTLYEYPRA